jgi:hypothetical protein
MGKGCSGATHQGPIRGPQRNPHFRWKPFKGPGPPMSRVGPRRLSRQRRQAWLPAARAKSGPRLPGRWTGAEGATGADAHNRLVWLGPITQAKARSESCPPRETLGVRCLEDRPALLGLGVRGRERSGGARDRRGRGIARGPDGIRATLTLIVAHCDQARGYQARSS